jgi:hypothetical protein
MTVMNSICLKFTGLNPQKSRQKIGKERLTCNKRNRRQGAQPEKYKYIYS